MNTMSDGALSPLLPLTIREMIDRRVAEDAEFVYCRFGELALTMGELDRRANCFANGLLALGIAAFLMASDKQGLEGEYSEPAKDLGMRPFLAALTGHAMALQAGRS